MQLNEIAIGEPIKANENPKGCWKISLCVMHGDADGYSENTELFYDNDKDDIKLFLIIVTILDQFFTAFHAQIPYQGGRKELLTRIEGDVRKEFGDDEYDESPLFNIVGPNARYQGQYAIPVSG